MTRKVGRNGRENIVINTHRNVAVGLRSLVVPEENCLITIKHPRVSEFTFDYRHETYRCRRCITGVCGVLSWMITWVASISSHSELSSAESTFGTSTDYLIQFLRNSPTICPRSLPANLNFFPPGELHSTKSVHTNYSLILSAPLQSYYAHMPTHDSAPIRRAYHNSQKERFY